MSEELSDICLMRACDLSDICPDLSDIRSDLLDIFKRVADIVRLLLVNIVIICMAQNNTGMKKKIYVFNGRNLKIFSLEGSKYTPSLCFGAHWL